MKDFLTKNWQSVIIIILCISTIVCWQLYQSKRNEIAAGVAMAELDKTIKSIESKIASIEEREKNLYPKIEEQLGQLDKVRKEISDIKKTLKVPNKGEINNEFKKMGLNDINTFFNQYGYATQLGVCK